MLEVADVNLIVAQAGGVQEDEAASQLPQQFETQ